MRSRIRTGLLGAMAGLFLAGIAQADKSILAELEVYGLERMAKQVSDISATVGKDLPPEAVTGMLGQVLGNPTWEGIDTDGVFRIIVAGDQSVMEADNPPMVLILPILDGIDPVANALSTFANQEAGEDGMLSFSRNDDAPLSFPEKVFLTQGSGGAILGMEKDVVEAVRDLLPEDPPERKSLGTAVLTMHLGKIMEIFKPVIEAQVDSVTEMMTSAQESSSADGPQMDPGAILAAEADLFMVIVQQIEKASLGIALEEGIFRINSAFDPVENSGFAGTLAQAKPPQKAFQNIMPGNSIYAQAGYLPGMDKLIGSYMDFLRTMYTSMGPEMEKISDKIMASTEKLLGDYTGEYAFGIAPGEDGGLIPSIVQVLSVADSESFKAAMDELIEIQEDLWDPDVVGYEYSIVKQESRTYKDADIQTIRADLDFDDEVEGQFPPGFAGFLKNLRYDIAVLDNTVLFTYGGSNVTERAIDKIQSGGGTPVHQHEAFKSVYPEISGMPIDVYYFQAFDLARAVVKLLPEEMKAEAPAIPEGPGTLAGYSVAEGGTLYSYGAFRGQVVTAIAGMITAIAAPAFSSAMNTGHEMALQDAAAMDPCASNLRQMAMACFLYAGDHENELPTSVNQLNEYLGSSGEGISDVMLCPHAEDRSVSSYRIVATGKISYTNDMSSAPLIEEINALHDGKRWIAYGDGHVDLVEE